MDFPSNLECSDKDLDVIRDFARKLQAAKERALTEEDFFGDPDVGKAYDRVLKLARQKAGPDTLGIELMGYELFKLGERVWKSPSLDQESFQAHSIDQFQNGLLNAYLPQWILLVPVERCFQSLPEFTDFGKFQIINPRALEADQSWGKVVKSLLIKNYPDLADALRSEGDSIAQQLDHQIAKTSEERANPAIVVQLKRGDELANAELGRSICQLILPLFQFVHVAYRLSQNSESWITDARKLWDGLYYNLGQAIMISILGDTGIVHLNSPHLHPYYEDRNERDVDADRFLSLWQEYGRPLMDIASIFPKTKVVERLVSATRLISLCRYHQFSNLELLSVISMEAILSPLNDRENLSERFAIFGSHLTSKSKPDLQLRYRELKKLYNRRSNLVHGAKKSERNLDLASHWRGDAISHEESAEQLTYDTMAFNYFLAMYKEIVAWIENCHKSNPAATIDENFRQFYLDTVLSQKTSQ